MLVYHCRTRLNQLRKIEIELADTEFVARWKHYLISTSKRLPKISWRLLVGGCRVEHRVETPPLSKLQVLYDTFRFLKHFVPVDLNQEILELARLVDNPELLRQSHLNTWHRHFTSLDEHEFEKMPPKIERAVFEAIHSINQNVHELENCTYFRLENRELIRGKPFNYINCTDSREETNRNLLWLGSETIRLKDEIFDPFKENYRYSVWLNEDIKGKDMFKSWMEEDDLSAFDCTGNLVMTPNIVMDPHFVFASIIDHPKWREKYIQSKKKLNRWPLGNILGIEKNQWAELSGGAIETVTLDNRTLW